MVFIFALRFLETDKNNRKMSNLRRPTFCTDLNGTSPQQIGSGAQIWTRLYTLRDCHIVWRPLLSQEETQHEKLWTLICRHFVTIWFAIVFRKSPCLSEQKFPFPNRFRSYRPWLTNPHEQYCLLYWCAQSSVITYVCINSNNLCYEFWEIKIGCFTKSPV